MKYTPILVALCSTFAFTSCGEKATNESSTPANAASSITVESIIASTAPADAIAIAKAQDSVQPGDEVTVSGKVMGRKDPFVDGRAMLVLGDPNEITSCDMIEGDGCPTPWDVCCDDPETIKQSVATIQVVDAEGKLLKQGIKGVGGIKELSQLTVTGVVAEGSNGDNLIINASSIYVQP
ncbi:hypothetical protein [Sulfuriroseicoccus oceanibius]|uniref:Uncharacterized protein n=1 Tax=Sulfuriroseicoccus oceanibius TaxID=2707525 RepID=A0A6B3L3E1_9BACT|nr:hypothetical protein [Sulfuriroseicoccus oceanibius]QQL45595.1 hypothetical protein G3M56_003120 [Sulfuriroseicoccus oceanibius]